MRLRLILLLLLPALAACEESVAPTLNLGAPFTLYGRFDPRADLQALRVVPIDNVLRPTTAEPLDAAVTSTNLRTGTTVTWRDSVVTFTDGTVGHVFVAPFRAEYDTRYRVEAVRSDGARTAATATVPPFVEPLVQTPESANGSVRLRVLWPSAPRLNAGTVEYTLLTPNCSQARITLPLVPETSHAFEFGWITDVALSRDRAAVLAAAEVHDAAVLHVTLAGLVANEDWVPPGGTFDPELLVEPTAFTNVENGFGFVGGGYPLSFEAAVPPTAARQAGWTAAGSFGC